MKRNPIRPINEYTDKELLEMKKREATQGLPERAQRFCEYYIEGHNYKTALIKAGYNHASSTYARRLLMNEKIQRYVQWLKARAIDNCLVNASDLIDEWVRIAFADISDFVDIHHNFITLKPNEEIDGQLVKSITCGRNGVSIELYDKMRALDNLSRYLQDMPQEWKQKLELRKAELMEQEFQLKKKMIELENPEQEDDGFLEAIKEASKAVWDNTTEV